MFKKNGCGPIKSRQAAADEGEDAGQDEELLADQRVEELLADQRVEELLPDEGDEELLPDQGGEEGDEEDGGVGEVAAQKILEEQDWT